MTVEASSDRWTVSWEGNWRGPAPRIVLAPPGFAPVDAPPGVRRFTVMRGAAREDVQP